MFPRKNHDSLGFGAWPDSILFYVCLSFQASLDLVCRFFFDRMPECFFNPSRQAAIPSVVARKDLAEANSFSSATDSMIGILGAVLGGIVSTAFNPLVCFVINAISYFWSAFCIFQMKWSESVSPSHSDSYFKSLKKGVHEASRNQVARAIILIGISWGFAGGGYYILIPLLGNNVYQMQGLGIGILYAVDGLGVLTGAYLVKKFVNHQYRRGLCGTGLRISSKPFFSLFCTYQYAAHGNLHALLDAAVFRHHHPA